MVKESIGTFAGGRFFGARGVVVTNPSDDWQPDPDRPCAAYHSEPEQPRADCGCLTYWEHHVEGDIGSGQKTVKVWTAIHKVGCLRMPIRRREAIEHSRIKTS